MHAVHHASPLTVVFILSNLAIVAGYLVVPFTRMGRSIPMTRRVRVAGMLFFGTCAITHLSMALFWPMLWPLVISHIVQAFSVWYFILGFSRLLAAAEVKRQARRAGTGQPQQNPAEP